MNFRFMFMRIVLIDKRISVNLAFVLYYNFENFELKKSLWKISGYFGMLFRMPRTNTPEYVDTHF